MRMPRWWRGYARLILRGLITGLILTKRRGLGMKKRGPFQTRAITC
jgi:hypothetical protein